MIIGPFPTTAPVIPASETLVSTSGYYAATPGVGHADYRYDNTLNAAFVAAHPHFAFAATDGRVFVLCAENGVTVTQAGFKPDGVTDNYPRFNSLLAFLAVMAVGSGYYKGVPKIIVPNGKFYINGRIELKNPVWIEGSAPPLGFGAETSWLDFADGGFRVNRYNTMNGAVVSPTTGADGSTFIGLRITSRASRPAAGSYAANSRDGIYALARIVVDKCAISGFTRDGICLDSGNAPNRQGTDYSGLTDGNTNCSVITDSLLQHNGRNGLTFGGVDSNACNLSNLSLDFNNNWGIYDVGFITNNHSGHHFSENGQKSYPGTKGDASTSVVIHPATSGTLYYVSPGQESAASTTTPGTNNAIWVKQIENAGGYTATATIPSWTSGMAIKSGGSIYIDSRNWIVAENLYVELGQGQPFINDTGGGNGVFVGGTWEAHPNSKGGFVFGNPGGTLTSTKGFRTRQATAAGQVLDLNMGTGLTGGLIWQYQDSVNAPAGFQIRQSGDDLYFTNGGTANPAIWWYGEGNPWVDHIGIPKLRVGTQAALLQSSVASPQGVLSGTYGDFCFNKGAGAGQPALFMNIGTTNWMSVGVLGLTRAAAQANSTAPDVATLVSDFNALLAKLRTAGVMAP